MLGAACLGFLWAPLWLLAVVLGPTALYLLTWASLGGGLWCRGHKGFDGV